MKKIPDDVDLRKITLSKNKIKKQVKMDLFKGLKLHLKLMVSYAAIRVFVCVREWVKDRDKWLKGDQGSEITKISLNNLMFCIVLLTDVLLF